MLWPPRRRDDSLMKKPFTKPHGISSCRKLPLQMLITDSSSSARECLASVHMPLVLWKNDVWAVALDSPAAPQSFA